MPTPNLFLVYVTDVERATAFYRDLFEMEPLMTTPRYVPFQVAPGVLFSLWSGRSGSITPDTIRTSEVGLMVAGGSAVIDDIYERWSAKGVTVIEQPYDDVFGRTFVIADPDGNLIRVCPVDR